MTRTQFLTPLKRKISSHVYQKVHEKIKKLALPKTWKVAYGDHTVVQKCNIMLYTAIMLVSYKCLCIKRNQEIKILTLNVNLLLTQERWNWVQLCSKYYSHGSNLLTDHLGSEAFPSVRFQSWNHVKNLTKKYLFTKYTFLLAINILYIYQGTYDNIL